MFILGLFTCPSVHVSCDKVVLAVRRMFSDLNNFLDIDVGRLPVGQCILAVEISGSNGSFVILHFLSLALRGETTVCFVGLAQTFRHYASAGNKLTVNLSRVRDSGRLTFVDGLTSIGSDFVKSCATFSGPVQTGNKIQTFTCTLQTYHAVLHLWSHS